MEIYYRFTDPLMTVYHSSNVCLWSIRSVEPPISHSTRHESATSLSGLFASVPTRHLATHFAIPYRLLPRLSVCWGSPSCSRHPPARSLAPWLHLLLLQQLLFCEWHSNPSASRKLFGFLPSTSEVALLVIRQIIASFVGEFHLSFSAAAAAAATAPLAE